MVSELEQAITSECGKLLSEEDLKKIAARGFDPADQNIVKAHMMVELGSYSKFANDFYENLANIVSTKSLLDDAIQKANSESKASTEAEKKQAAENLKNDKTIAQLRDRLKQLEDEKDAFLKGEKNKYYAGQSIFLINNGLNSMFLDIADVHDYALLKHHTSYNDLPDYQQKQIDTEFNDYLSAEGSAKLLQAYDLYLSFSQQWGPTLQKTSELLKNAKGSVAHQDSLEYDNYVQLLKDYNDLTNQIQRLDRNKEDENKQIIELEQRRSEVNSKILAMQENSPAFILQLSLDDKKFGDLRDGFLNHVTDESISNMLNSLRSLYSTASGTYFPNDDQLNAFFSLIGKQYLKITPQSRFDDYLLNLLMEFDDDVAHLNKGEDQFVTNPGENTSFQKEITNAITDAIALLGYNNRDFVKKINEIKNILAARTNLSEEEIKDFFNRMLPFIDGKNILELISEFDGYRSNIIYDPFLESLSEILKVSIGDKNYSLVDILNIEAKRLADSEDLTKYVVQKAFQPVMDTKRLKPLSAALIGVISGA